MLTLLSRLRSVVPVRIQLITSQKFHSSRCKLKLVTNPINFQHRNLWPSFLQGTKTNTSLIQTIHTSRARYVNPLLMAVLRPASKFLVVLVGRGFRKWWQSLPTKKKQLFLQHLYRNRGRYIIISGVVGGGGYYYYQSHVTTALFTGRRRFTLFTSEQLTNIARAHYEVEMEVYGDLVLPYNHQYTQQVSRVGSRLLQANNTIPHLYTKAWTVTVIDHPTINCFVLPTGDIIMFRGMMNLLENDDQVAAVLAHEMSHAILDHAGENLSRGYLIDMLILVPLAFIWAFIPSNGIAAVTHWFINKVVQVFLTLPFSRTLENEADTVGLRLAAQACYDVREASAFWGKMSLMENNTDAPTWLSTHPSNIDRQTSLDSLMDQALAFRETCKCPRLTGKDPRMTIKMIQGQRDKAAQDALNAIQKDRPTLIDQK